MSSFSLITRPGRAVAIVAVVGMLFGTQGAIALRWPQPGDGFGPQGYAGIVLLVAALVATGAGLSVLAPLHSRLGAVGVAIVRLGLAGPLLGASSSLASGHDATHVLSWIGAIVAAPGIVAIVLARRDEADVRVGLLEAALVTAVAAPLLAGRGGGLLAGAAWVAVAVALYGSYLAPAAGSGRAPARTRLPDPRRFVSVVRDVR